MTVIRTPLRFHSRICTDPSHHVDDNRHRHGPTPRFQCHHRKHASHRRFQLPAQRSPTTETAQPQPRNHRHHRLATTTTPATPTPVSSVLTAPTLHPTTATPSLMSRPRYRVSLTHHGHHHPSRHAHHGRATRCRTLRGTLRYTGVPPTTTGCAATAHPTPASAARHPHRTGGPAGATTRQRSTVLVHRRRAAGRSPGSPVTHRRTLGNESTVRCGVTGPSGSSTATNNSSNPNPAR